MIILSIFVKVLIYAVIGIIVSFILGTDSTDAFTKWLLVVIWPFMVIAFIVFIFFYIFNKER